MSYLLVNSALSMMVLRAAFRAKIQERHIALLRHWLQLMQSQVPLIFLHYDSEFPGGGQQELGVWRQVVQSRQFCWR